MKDVSHLISKSYCVNYDDFFTIKEKPNPFMFQLIEKLLDDV